MNKKTLTILIVYFLAGISVATYYPTLFNHIINWEDADLFSVVSSLLKGKAGLLSHPEYAPLELGFLAFQRSFSEYGYFLFHALSMIGHAVNAVMLFFLIRKLFASEKIAFVVSLLFAVHPVEVGSVAWLSSQNVVFSTLLLFLTAAAYLRFKRDGKNLYWWLVVLSSALFYLMGSPALNLILILIGLDILSDSKLKIKHVTGKGPLFLLWLVSLLFRAGRSGGWGYLIQLCDDSVAMIRLGVTELVARVLLPFQDKLVTSGDEIALKSSVLGESIFPLIFLAIAAVVIWNRRRYPIVFSGFLFLTVTSLPIFTGRAAGNWVLLDRSFYLPVVGLFLAFGEMLEKIFSRLKEHRGASWALYVLCACVFLALAHSSRTRTEYWKDNITFWGEAHAENPANTFILTKRGMYYFSKYEIAPALDDLNLVVKLAPEDGESFISRGIVHLDALDTEDAINDFSQAIRLRLSDQRAFYILGLALMRSSKLDSAETAFSRAIDLDPGFAQAFDGRATAFAKAGKYVLACADYHRALELVPDYAEAYGSRAFMFLQSGNFQRALEDFRKQIELAPSRFDAKIHCGFTELLLGDSVSASSYFSSALSLDSANAKMYLLSVSKLFLRSKEETQAGKRLLQQLGLQ